MKMDWSLSSRTMAKATQTVSGLMPDEPRGWYSTGNSRTKYASAGVGGGYAPGIFRRGMAKLRREMGKPISGRACSGPVFAKSAELASEGKGTSENSAVLMKL